MSNIFNNFKKFLLTSCQIWLACNCFYLIIWLRAPTRSRSDSLCLHFCILFKSHVFFAGIFLNHHSMKLKLVSIIGKSVHWAHVNCSMLSAPLATPQVAEFRSPLRIYHVPYMTGDQVTKRGCLSQCICRISVKPNIFSFLH